MYRTSTTLHTLPSNLVSKLCRTKATRLSLKQMYTFGRHVLDSKNQSALVIPAVFLHQELPVRLSHALSLLNPSRLPPKMAEVPVFQQIAHSYLEDISMILQIPKPSTPKLEQEFTSVLRNLEHRQHLKMLAFSQGVKGFLTNLQTNPCSDETGYNNPLLLGRSQSQNPNQISSPMTIDPLMDQTIQKIFDQFYTINLGTRLLIGEHIALHDHKLNLVQRVNPLNISRRAIKDAQRICSSYYGRPAPSVMIQTLDPNFTTTYIEEFLHRNIYELLKNSMRATCEAHLQEGSPVSLGMSTRSSKGLQGSSSTAKESKLPPIMLTLVNGSEDVTIKISDSGSGICLSELENIWSYVRPQGQSISPLSTMTTTESAYLGGFGRGSKEYLDLPLAGSGDGLPLARLMAQYFGGDLSLASMEGHGTDSYLSLFKDDDHLENLSEMDQEILREVDVFVNELLESYVNNNKNPEISGIPLPKSSPSPSPSSPSLPLPSPPLSSSVSRRAMITATATSKDIPLKKISDLGLGILPGSSLPTSLPSNLAVDH